MKRNSPFTLLQNAILLCTFLLIANPFQYTFAQIHSKNGGATSNSTFLWGGGTFCRKSQIIYLPSDFLPAISSNGDITTLYYMYGNSGIATPSVFTNLTIKMG